MIKEEALIDAGFRKRINKENTDVYKIISILYGLVIFIGGVAFSILHAIIPREDAEIIKYFAEFYFTYLYCVSIIWIIFCMIDIIHHRNKVKIPTDTKRTSLPGDVRLVQNTRISTTSEASQKLENTSEINVDLFDKLEEEQSDDNDDEQAEFNSNKESIDDDNRLSLPDHLDESNYVNDFLHRSSLARQSTETTRNISTRRCALIPSEKKRLRTYIRRRKNSIVQHVIGYNYDDNSTAGGLYTRVGIGIFCLGTVIHSCLSILSNLENRLCTRWTAVMDDLSRLLFSFIQFFFIFKHSNLIIRAHESLARLAVIHIVVTNLCVWFRMVVIETKSQILEMSDHGMAVAQHNNIVSHSNNIIQDKINLLHHPLMFDSECANLVANGLSITTFIHEGYMTLKPFLYPCTIEFSLMCLTLFFLIWENIGKTFTHKISDQESTKNIFMLDCHASIKGLFVGMIVFSCTLISIILYVAFRHKVGDNIHMIPSLFVETTHGHPHANLTSTAILSYPQHTVTKSPKRVDYGIAIIDILNLCLLALSLCATIWSLIKMRRLSYRQTTTRFDDVLIIISLTGIYLYSIFSAFAIISSLSSSTWVAYVKITIITLGFIEGTVQALFILIALRKRLRRTSKSRYPAREMITLMIMIDLSLWLEETTTTTKHEANLFQLAFYNIVPWSIIAAIATPLLIFFRFHASVCLSHVWADMYHLPVDETVSSSDL